MAVSRQWRGRSRQLALLLAAVLVPPAVTLVWLGATILKQDRDIAASHADERRASAVQSVVLSLEQSLNEAARYLETDVVPDGMVKVVVSGDRVTATPAARLLWVPARSSGVVTGEDRFAVADRAAFGGREAEALAEYREAARSPVAGVKALALVSIARVHRQQRRWDLALTAYRSLAGITAASVAGAPADLQARRQICDVLATMGRGGDLNREVDALRRDLLSGQWQIDGPAWAQTVADLERWSGKPVEVDAERRRLSLAAEDLLLRQPPASGDVTRQTVAIEGTAITVLTRRTADGAVSLLAGSTQLAQWTEIAMRGLSGATDLGLIGKQGEMLAGRADSAGPTATRRAEETGLPWTVRLTWRGASDVAAEGASRTSLLLVGLAAILALAGGGGYLLWRVVQRELAITRLQSEFVSAVSHEFRTPLTSLRHATELLHEHDDLSRDRRRAFYDAMMGDTRRLQRLVESLLDFSRMESGRKAYDLKPVRVADFVTEVVDEFRASRRGGVTIIDVDTGGSAAAVVHADTASLANAVWNLLDNAVKYSPPGTRVNVVVHRSEGSVSIAVADRGLGIPASEQKDVFGRFVRGAAAATSGIPGTGLGLALVSHIVDAHAGTVRLESEPGRGSTFTIALPEAAGSTAGGS